MWTWFHSDGNMPMQYVVSTASDQTIDNGDGIPALLSTNMLTERDQESSRLRARVPLCVKTRICTQATTMVDK